MVFRPSVGPVIGGNVRSGCAGGRDGTYRRDSL